LEQGRIDCSGSETSSSKTRRGARWRTGDCQLGDFPKPTLTGSPAFLKKEKLFLLSVFSIALIAQDSDCFGNRWPRRKRHVRLRGNAQAIFCRRRHQPRRPPLVTGKKFLRDLLL
jgi:hypothetical protein